MSPFAGFKDFDTCVVQNKDKRDPKAYCAAVQARSEGKTDLSERDQVIADHFAEGDKPGFAYRLGVEVFKAGSHTNSRGEEKKWTTKDLDHMVNNFNDKVPPFASIKSGHSSAEFNEKLAKALGVPPLMVSGDGDERDGQVSLGRVTNLYRHEDSLLATFELPTVISGLIDSGGINSVSAEILHNYKGKGFALGGVALLGAERPALAGLESFDEGDTYTSVFTEHKEAVERKARTSGLAKEDVEKTVGLAEDTWDIMVGAGRDHAGAGKHQSAGFTIVRIIQDRFARIFKEGRDPTKADFDEIASDVLTPQEEQWLFPLTDKVTGRNTSIQVGAPNESSAKIAIGNFLETLASTSGAGIGSAVAPVVASAIAGGLLARFTLGRGQKLGTLIGGIAGFEEQVGESDYYIYHEADEDDFAELASMYDEDSEPAPLSRMLLDRSDPEVEEVEEVEESDYAELVLTVGRVENSVSGYYWNMREAGAGGPVAGDTSFASAGSALADARAFAEDEGWAVETMADGKILVFTGDGDPFSEQDEQDEMFEDVDSEFAIGTRAVHSLGILKRAGKKVGKKVAKKVAEEREAIKEDVAHARLKHNLRRRGMSTKNVARPKRKRKFGTTKLSEAVLARTN